MDTHDPSHPGGILKEVLESIPMSVTAFAKHIGVSRVTLSRVINGRARFTPEMSLKISAAFGQNQGDIWFLMQNDHDFWKASRKAQEGLIPERPQPHNRGSRSGAPARLTTGTLLARPGD